MTNTTILKNGGLDKKLDSLDTMAKKMIGTADTLLAHQRMLKMQLSSINKEIYRLKAENDKPRNSFGEGG